MNVIVKCSLYFAVVHINISTIHVYSIGSKSMNEKVTCCSQASQVLERISSLNALSYIWAVIIHTFIFLNMICISNMTFKAWYMEMDRSYVILGLNVYEKGTLTGR